MALVPNVIQPMAAEAHALVRSGVKPKDAVTQVVGNFADKAQAGTKGLRAKFAAQLNKLNPKQNYVTAQF
jgi:hypothetical protein